MMESPAPSAPEQVVATTTPSKSSCNKKQKQHARRPFLSPVPNLAALTDCGSSVSSCSTTTAEENWSSSSSASSVASAAKQQPVPQKRSAIAPVTATKQEVPLEPPNDEESIQVVFRMRPLNNGTEAQHGRAWMALEGKSSIIETTPDGYPINSPLAGNHHHDRIQPGRNVFCHDKTFGENASTRDVYRNVAQNIVTSAIAPGLNGTIFAYGQTSSGKTYTMQGDGLDGDHSNVVGSSTVHNNNSKTMAPLDEEEQGFDDEAPGDEFADEMEADHHPDDDNVSESSSAANVPEEEGGIIHMAAKDIFDKINDNPDRVFTVKVSYIEIYNEEVRDLLVMSSGDPLSRSVLSVREDPQRGFFVPSKEERVKDVDSMIDLLVQGNKSRVFAATAMNTCSSRSHTIFRVVVESRGRKKPTENQQDDQAIYSNASDNEDHEVDEESAIRYAALNFVDLAGSESVRHTGATGDSLKEGCRINTSLSVLSRVIEALGTQELHPSKTILPPFRESKLTRILQPSLSGNARMVMICCGTPSALYKEKTRSTLHFAARAKLVKTNAKVNEVLDDKAMIRKLQKQLAHARRLLAKCDTKQLESMEEEYTATNDKVYRLQNMLIELLFDVNNGQQTERRFPVDDSFLDNVNANTSSTLTPLTRSNSPALMMQSLALPMTHTTNSVDISPLSSMSDLLRVALEQKADEVLLQQERFFELKQQQRKMDAELALVKEHNSSLQRQLKMVKEQCKALKGSEKKLKTELKRLKTNEPFDAAVSDESEGEDGSEVFYESESTSFVEEDDSEVREDEGAFAELDEEPQPADDEDVGEPWSPHVVQEGESGAQDEEDAEFDTMEAEMWWSLENIHDENVPKRGAVPLLERCMVKYSWEEAFALRVLEAYKQFLTLQKEQDADGEVLIPIGPVKLMWNEHFLDVDNYVNDCMLLCGHVVKHNDLDEEDLNSDTTQLDEKTRMALERLGFTIEDDLWTFLRPSQEQSSPSQETTEEENNDDDAFDLFSAADNSAKDAFVGSFEDVGDERSLTEPQDESLPLTNNDESNRLSVATETNNQAEPAAHNPVSTYSFVDEDDPEAYF